MRTQTALPTPAQLVAFAAAALLVLATAGPAQAWNEIGDAGSLVATSQITVGTGSLTQINGNLASPTDVDLYCVRLSSVAPAGLPIVSLQCVVIQGPNVWLFNAAGHGVFSNSTCSAGNKTILAPSVSLPVGTYYVAVSYTGIDPQSAAGAIWLSAPPTQRAPDGPGAAGPLTGWAGVPNVQPINPYQVNLSFMTHCDAPTPVTPTSWGTLKIRYGY